MPHTELRRDMREGLGHIIVTIEFKTPHGKDSGHIWGRST